MIIVLMLSLPIQSGTHSWLIRLVTLLLAALAAGSALYWALKWPAKPEPTHGTIAAPKAPEIDSNKLALLLGASQSGAGEAPATNVQVNYKLLGVIAQGGLGSKGTMGSALIAVEGSLAKPYRVGDVVADGLVLQSVKAHSAVMGPEGKSGGTVTLELPPLPGMPVNEGKSGGTVRPELPPLPGMSGTPAKP